MTADTFVIGAEQNAPVGGVYCHKINESYSVNMNEVGSIEYSIDPKYGYDEEEHANWQEEWDSEEEYLQHCENYDCETYDNDGHHLEFINGDRDEIREAFGDAIAERIFNREGRQVNENTYWLEDLAYEGLDNVDVNDVNAVNKAAKRISSPGGVSSYLLTDGDIVSFADHIYVNAIGNLSRQQFVALGNIRLASGGETSIQLAKRPTFQQCQYLKGYLRGRFSVDICPRGDFDNPSSSASYYVEDRNDASRVVNQILSYFDDGINLISENLELEVEPEEVDLSSFKKQKTLAPKLWNGEELNSKARLKLLDIADDFWDFCNVTWAEVKGILLVGSICNYNWSKESDIDLHLVVNFKDVDDKRLDFVQEYFDDKKNLWNQEHENLRIYGFPVELYVQDTDADTETGGIYDLEENEWLKKPDEDDVKSITIEKYLIKHKAAKIMTRIDDLVEKMHATNDKHIAEMTAKEAREELKKIQAGRKSSLEKYGESGSGNVLYKLLRRTSYLDKLWDIVSYGYDKVNSINEGIEGDIYQEFCRNQELRYRLIPDIVGDGYVVHGTPDSFDDFNTEKIKGGTRGQYGYGVYFTDAAYKCEEYGSNFKFLKIDDFKLLNLNTYFDAENNPLTDAEEEWAYANKLLDSARNNMEYDAALQKVEKLEGITESPIFQKALMLVKYNKYISTFKDLNNTIGGYEDVAKQVAEMWLALGFDGYKCDNQYVIFNFEKLSENLVRDNNAFLKGYAENAQIKANLPKMVENALRRGKETLNEEVVADGSADSNPYKKRWKLERDQLKKFIINNGRLMTSMENGKLYKVIILSDLTNLIGNRYCVCLEYDPYMNKEGTTVYIRAFDKFTYKIFRAQFDTRGRDNDARTAY